MKYHKGHNGIKRKADRTLKRMSSAYSDGANFNELWAIFEPLEALRFSIPSDDLAQKPICQAMELLHKAANDGYEDEIIDGYWAIR